MRVRGGLDPLERAVPIGGHGRLHSFEHGFGTHAGDQHALDPRQRFPIGEHVNGQCTKVPRGSHRPKRGALEHRPLEAGIADVDEQFHGDNRLSPGARSYARSGSWPSARRPLGANAAVGWHRRSG